MNYRTQSTLEMMDLIERHQIDDYETLLRGLSQVPIGLLKVYQANTMTIQQSKQRQHLERISEHPKREGSELQMNLRKKRNFTSYHNEQHYNSLEEYDEVTKGGTRKEGQPRTSDHGSIAKLLVDFINQINSSMKCVDADCRQNKRLSKDKERRNMSRSDERVTPEPRKKVKLDQNSDSYSGPAKKNISHNTEEKAQEKYEDKKYTKELYRFKDQQPPQLKNFIPQAKAGQGYTPRIQHPTHPPNLVAMMSLNHNLFSNNEFLNLANLHNLSGLSGLQNINSLAPLGNMNLNMFMQQHQFGQKLPSYVCPPEALMKMNNSDFSLPKQPQRKLEKTSENKLFKRAAFHVAIAYHIHLKKIQDKEKNHDSVELDPTYYAKKLRQKNNDANANKQEMVVQERLMKHQTAKPSDTTPAIDQQSAQITIEPAQPAQTQNNPDSIKADQPNKLAEVATSQP